MSAARRLGLPLVQRSLLLALLSAAGPPAWARSPGRAEEEARQAAEQLAAGQQALARGDLTEARRVLEAAYRLRPAADGLLELGRLALRSGLAVEAQDLLRRYAAEVGDEAVPADVRSALALPTPPFAEVKVIGPRGAVLLLDERLVGVLPLARPLWVAAGKHRLTLEPLPQRHGSQAVPAAPIGGALAVQPSRGVEVRYSERSAAMIVSTHPAVFLLWQNSSVKTDEALRAAAEDELRRARLDPVPPASRPTLSGDLTRCQQDLGCQARRCEREQIEYVLRVRTESVEAARGALRFSVQLLDAPIRDVAQEATAVCEACDGPRAASELGALLRRVLRAGLDRPRAEIEVASSPPGAAVSIDGRAAGSSPLLQPVFAGDHVVEVALSGFVPQRRSLTLAPDETARLAPLLARDPGDELEPPPGRPLLALGHTPAAVLSPEHAARPRWRLALGGVTVGAGLWIAGFGVSGLVQAGSCTDPVVDPVRACGYRFDTQTVGGALLATGLVVSTAGALLMALPSRPRPSVRVAASGLGLAWR